MSDLSFKGVRRGQKLIMAAIFGVGGILLIGAGLLALLLLHILNRIESLTL